MPGPIYVGTAGWSIPREYGKHFPGPGSHLERYARVFAAVENDSTFYGVHERGTYVRWAASTPPAFRFAVKIPRAISHYARLKRTRRMLVGYLSAVRGLGRKLGPLLLQLPVSLPYDPPTARAFFALARRRHRGPIVFEPRHASWFDAEVDALLVRHRIARVAADPPPVPAAIAPGGWPTLVYFRLHGSPEMYYSAYSRAFLEDLAGRILDASRRATVWCIFDNTAAGAAMGNALELVRELRSD